MKLSAQLLLLCLILFIFVFVLPVFASTSVSVINVPASIDKEQEIETEVLLTCSGCSSDSYLRGVFYPSGTSYFGFTQNNDGVWINAPGGSCVQYFKISQTELVEGSWSGKLKVKPDISSSLYTGPGEYLFKVGRYTSSCSSPTWSPEKTISITGPTPTQTPAPRYTPTSTHAVTSTLTPTPTQKKNTPTSTVTVTPTSVSDTDGTSSDSAQNAHVLGVTETNDTSGSQATSSSIFSTKPLIISLLFVSSGLALLSGVFVWQKRNAMTKKHT